MPDRRVGRSLLPPRPWRVHAPGANVVEIQDARGRVVIKWTGFDGSDAPPRAHEAIAERIVAAVNGGPVCENCREPLGPRCVECEG